ncbi:ADP-ribosylglycohydrolase family protein, partial [Curtobacterium sp. B8]|uniref:ADP-ribosylglycohydrolase family protein n=1 Tax=Curtobacterium sp. B8 TaxID=95611 RepID=UPI0003B76DBC
MNTTTRDRAIGAVLGSAAGDALGAGYEFRPVVPEPTPIRMAGGGSFGWAPGEWTDDTSMAVPILRTLARGGDPASEVALDGLVAAWADWARTAPDVGIQTRNVLTGLEVRTAVSARAAARQEHEFRGRSAGNGSLMRTAPLVLGYLTGAVDEELRLAEAARAISDLTHYESDAGDACALWCVAIREAVLTGELDVMAGLDLLDLDKRRIWVDRIVTAEHSEPVDFTDSNGWVVSAFQAAYAAVRRSTSLEDALVRAVRTGNDTDTVAAIAGGLAGALYGASALPAEWRELL